MQARVLIVEDETEISGLISAYLKKEGIDAVAVATGEEGIELFQNETFDLVILDLSLPGIDGYEVLQKIRASRDTPVIIVSARNEDADMLLGFGMGADDFVCKPFSPRVLTARVRTHIQRQKKTTEKESDCYVFGDYIIDPESFCLKKNGVRVKLRPKELELLIYLAKRRGQIISAEELYSAIWGNGHGDISTIPVHIRRIRDRLETNSSFPEFLKTVYGKGYYLQ